MFQVQHGRQNKMCFCPLLRQQLKRAGYPWGKHPNCSRYNGDNGCMILLPFCSTDYNGGVPYDNMLEFFDDVATHPTLTVLTFDKQRKLLYRVLNDAIGGPHGKVCLMIRSPRRFCFFSDLQTLFCSGSPSAVACVRHAPHPARVRPVEGILRPWS